MNDIEQLKDYEIRCRVVTEAYNLIKEKKNWTQKTFYKVVGFGGQIIEQYCVIGALSNRCRNIPTVEQEQIDIIHSLIDELNTFIKENYPTTDPVISKLSPLVAFNDYRNHEEVVEMLFNFGRKFGYIFPDNNVT